MKTNQLNKALADVENELLSGIVEMDDDDEEMSIEDQIEQVTKTEA